MIEYVQEEVSDITMNQKHRRIFFKGKERKELDVINDLGEHSSDKLHPVTLTEAGPIKQQRKVVVTSH